MASCHFFMLASSIEIGNFLFRDSVKIANELAPYPWARSTALKNPPATLTCVPTKRFSCRSFCFFGSGSLNCVELRDRLGMFGSAESRWETPRNNLHFLETFRLGWPDLFILISIVHVDNGKRCNISQYLNTPGYLLTSLLSWMLEKIFWRYLGHLKCATIF